MEILQAVFDQAASRAKEQGFPYAGSLTPAEAATVLAESAGAVLIDVRSRQELDLVGRVPVAKHVEWSFYPDWKPNAEFLNQLSTQADKNVPVLFLCRTGGRSHNAAVAATNAGFTQCYNVLEGFEGTSNQQGQRGQINGWKASGLPWSN